MYANSVAVLEEKYLFLHVNRANIREMFRCCILVIHRCVSCLIMYYVITFNDLNKDESKYSIHLIVTSTRGDASL